MSHCIVPLYDINWPTDFMELIYKGRLRLRWDQSKFGDSWKTVIWTSVVQISVKYVYVHFTYVLNFVFIKYHFLGLRCKEALRLMQRDNEIALHDLWAIKSNLLHEKTELQLENDKLKQECSIIKARLDSEKLGSTKHITQMDEYHRFTYFVFCKWFFLLFSKINDELENVCGSAWNLRVSLFSTRRIVFFNTSYLFAKFFALLVILKNWITAWTNWSKHVLSSKSGWIKIHIKSGVVKTKQSENWKILSCWQWQNGIFVPCETNLMLVHTLAPLEKN